MKALFRVVFWFTEYKSLTTKLTYSKNRCGMLLDERGLVGRTLICNYADADTILCVSRMLLKTVRSKTAGDRDQRRAETNDASARANTKERESIVTMVRPAWLCTHM